MVRTSKPCIIWPRCSAFLVGDISSFQWRNTTALKQRQSMLIVMNAAGRTASVQPSPRGGDGFCTPVVHNTPKPQRKSVLEETRANALAAHATTAHKLADLPSANLTDNLLNI